MLKILRWLLLGKRIILLSSGYCDRGFDSKVRIGVITSIEYLWVTSSYSQYCVGINQYGGDVTEEQYKSNNYTWGSYGLKGLFYILLSQPFLKSQYTCLDLSKEPKDFYNL